jgi:hypothetical protein
VPVYAPPPPTHGFSWEVDEWVSSLPDRDDTSDFIPVGAPPPAQAAPPVVVSASGTSMPAVQPVGGGTPTGTPLAPQAAAIVDRVIGSTVVRNARIRTTDESTTTRPRLLARRSAPSDLAPTARYAALVSSSASSLSFSLATTTRRDRGLRTASNAAILNPAHDAARAAALASILSNDE